VWTVTTSCDWLVVLLDVEVELVDELVLLLEVEEELEELVDDVEVVPPQATEKLVPSLEMAEGSASTEPEFDTIVISCTADPKEPIDPVTPLTVA
jgi:hypothetical protein